MMSLMDGKHHCYRTDDEDKGHHTHECKGKVCMDYIFSIDHQFYWFVNYKMNFSCIVNIILVEWIFPDLSQRIAFRVVDIAIIFFTENTLAIRAIMKKVTSRFLLIFLNQKIWGESTLQPIIR